MSAPTPPLPTPSAPTRRQPLPDWYRKLSDYEKPSTYRATRQLLNTLIPYAGLWFAMAWMLTHGVSYWGGVFPTAILAGCLLIRVFIFFHDCGHESFFASAKANKFFGYLCGILVFTSFEDWRRPHARHHATAGDQDRRGVGDVWTMTVEEFKAATPLNRTLYQLYRIPIFMFTFGPGFMFLIGNRFPHRGTSLREKLSTLYTNIGLIAVATVMSFAMGGFMNYLSVQLPVMLTAATLGVWMFYVQHQFEGTYWKHHDEWSPIDAALQGSSYYKLPKLMQWFTGNIGLHHIHHLRPRIPNYNLQRCYDEVPAMQNVKPLTILESFKSLNMHLWDEQSEKLISFVEFYRRQKAAKA
ncbi:fatty acid desaturase [Armatimonas rosea]|uniref:Omega-6 fatty acid desaturase (Delta-12 desaturase) n=1 Tax=Armatimonas rosea TaxID=685828 RepID=A0A7W9SR13_ARMRO|nr:fatty acid desaturase [Armatimonas rosea]MBB6051236.1 omega-6 fatty acid desaturase (delta-12 desaturase) [Armatimonas rosea]